MTHRLTRCFSMPAACCATRRGRASPTRWCATARAVTAAALAAAEQKATRDIDKASVIGIDRRSRARLALFQPRAAARRRRAERRPPMRRSPSCASITGSDNLWEHVEPDVAPALAALRDRGLQAGRGVERQRPAASTCSIASTSRSGSITCSIRTSGASRSRIRGCSSSRSSSRAPTRRAPCTSATSITSTWSGARRAGLREGVLFDMAGLYDDVDCPRVASLAALVEWIDKPSGNQTRNRVP